MAHAGKDALLPGIQWLIGGDVWDVCDEAGVAEVHPTALALARKAPHTGLRAQVVQAVHPAPEELGLALALGEGLVEVLADRAVPGHGIGGRAGLAGGQRAWPEHAVGRRVDRLLQDFDRPVGAHVHAGVELHQIQLGLQLVAGRLGPVVVAVDGRQLVVGDGGYVLGHTVLAPSPRIVDPLGDPLHGPPAAVVGIVAEPPFPTQDEVERIIEGGCHARHLPRRITISVCQTLGWSPT